MGIGYWDARCLWEAHCRGSSFSDTLTIGNQRLNLHPAELRYFRNGSARRHGRPGLQNYSFGEPAERFLLELLGARSVSIMDLSAYEGATVIHDLNFPVAAQHHERYDAVIDGGSLEHIFNFPVAVANLMRMTKVGGSVYITTPANNLCGHGFYQFSPELMFRVFSAENGFELKQVILFEGRYPGMELAPKGPAYVVTDPADVKDRVGLQNSNPVSMIVEAVKRESVDIFAKPPLQSDYVTLWADAEDPQPLSSPSVKRRIQSMLPQTLSAMAEGTYMRYLRRREGRAQLKKNALSNGRFYTTIKR